MMKFKNVLIVLMIIVVLGSLSAFFLLSQQKVLLPNQQKINVVVSFYPLAEIAQNVGDDLVTVKNVTPAGVEPHDYEPTTHDIVDIYNAKLIVYNGNGLDPWADKLKEELEKKGVVMLKMSDHVDALDNRETEMDPHFWLNPLNMVKETEVITQALIAIDPAHENDYGKNREAYTQKLVQLDQEYTQALAHCAQNTIVTSHNAFNYLADRYRLKTLYIAGLSPEEEPSAQRMAEIVDQAKENNIKYIFFETLVSPKLAQTIASEIGAQVLTLNPLEGLTTEELQAGKEYVSIMKENLAHLKIALACQ